MPPKFKFELAPPWAVWLPPRCGETRSEGATAALHRPFCPLTNAAPPDFYAGRRPSHPEGAHRHPKSARASSASASQHGQHMPPKKNPIVAEAAPATPATVLRPSEQPAQRPQGGAGCGPGRAAAVAAAIAADAPAHAPAGLPKGREYLGNTDLHGLQPCLSVRTRILLAAYAENQMSPDDIGRSFTIAGYVPRKRCSSISFVAVT